MAGMRNCLTETETYVSLLRKRRQEVRNVLAGLSVEALNWLPVPTPPNGQKVSHSIVQLAYHSVVTEVDWRRHIAYRLGLITREEEQRGFENGELDIVADDPSPILWRLENDGNETDLFISRLSEGELGISWVNPRGESRSIRWVIGHIISYYGQCIGQMVLIRQLWEAQFVR
jgi:hypothetical protein